MFFLKNALRDIESLSNNINYILNCFHSSLTLGKFCDQVKFHNKVSLINLHSRRCFGVERSHVVKIDVKAIGKPHLPARGVEMKNHYFKSENNKGKQKIALE